MSKRRREDLPLAALDEIRPPHEARAHWRALMSARTTLVEQRQTFEKDLEELQRFFELEPRVAKALEQLYDRVFSQTLGVIETRMTEFLQVVLRQELRLKARVQADNRSGQKVDFTITRNGLEEDVLRGQGGSVANVLSVGLRLLALAQLDPARHRPVLFLDEADAWLRPELVPQLMAIIQEAARELGTQVVVITHHDYELVGPFADRVYEFAPGADGVEVRLREGGLLTQAIIPDAVPDVAEGLFGGIS